MRKHVKEKGNTNYTLGEKMYAIQLTKQSCQKYRGGKKKNYHKFSPDLTVLTPSLSI